MAICTREHSTANFLKKWSSGWRVLASLSVPQVAGLSLGFTLPTPGHAFVWTLSQADSVAAMGMALPWCLITCRLGG